MVEAHNSATNPLPIFPAPKWTAFMMKRIEGVWYDVQDIARDGGALYRDFEVYRSIDISHNGSVLSNVVAR